MAVDRKARDLADYLLDLLCRGSLDIADLQMRWPASADDEALRHVRYVVEGCFDAQNMPRWSMTAFMGKAAEAMPWGLPTHEKAVKDSWERCRRFLQSNREYRWHRLPAIEGREDVWGDYAIHLMLGGTREHRNFENKALERAKADIDAWPFFTRQELEEARKSPLRSPQQNELPPVISVPRRWRRGTLVCWKGAADTMDQLMQAGLPSWRFGRPDDQETKDLSRLARSTEEPNTRQPMLFEVHSRDGWVAITAGQEVFGRSGRFQAKLLDELSTVLKTQVCLYRADDSNRLVVDRRPVDLPKGPEENKNHDALLSRLSEFHPLLPLVGTSGPSKVVMFRSKYGTVRSAIDSFKRRQRILRLGLLAFWLLWIAWLVKVFWGAQLLAWLRSAW